MPRKCSSGVNLNFLFNFPTVAVLALLPLLVIMMILPQPRRHGSTIRIPESHHAVPLRDALREDALTVAVERDGKVYLGREQVSLESLHGRLMDHLRNGAPRQIFVSADRRANYGRVKNVVREIVLTGVYDVTFMAERPRS